LHCFDRLPLRPRGCGRRGKACSAQPVTERKMIMMTYDQIKDAVLNLDENDQKRLILEVIPQIWPKACTDDACLKKVRELVDEDAVKAYREQHLDHI
jgi:hypothetical protein